MRTFPENKLKYTGNYDNEQTTPICTERKKADTYAQPDENATCIQKV